METEEAHVSKNLDEAARIHPDTRKNRDYKELQRAAVALPIGLANLSTASLPGRNECPGTHCSLIVKKRHFLPEFEKKEKTERTEWQGQCESHRDGEKKWQGLLVLPGPAKKAQASVEKLEHTKPAKKKGVASTRQSER